MDDQNVENSKDMNLVLSTDAKPRLKWTPDLHQRFVVAVNQLGGPPKATPKSLMRIMGISGLTLYHLKSHLQKYRLGKNQDPKICKDLKQEIVECEESSGLNELNLFCEGNQVDDTNEDQIEQNANVADAIQLQMDVQRKIHEQIEVQRHLQLRIEAQGKYLQEVLKKAHEIISNYNCSTFGLENAKIIFSELASMVSTSSFSELTEATNLSLDQKHPMGPTRCSSESSLTSSESSKRVLDEERDTTKYSQETSPLVLSLCSKKRSRSTISKGIFVQEIVTKKSKEPFDMNRQCEDHDLNLGLKQPIVDLNEKISEEIFVKFF